MDLNEFPPPPPPEMFVEESSFMEEDEGEQFDFDDSGDEVPEADRPLPAPPAADYRAQSDAENRALAGQDTPDPTAGQAPDSLNDKGAGLPEIVGDLPPPVEGAFSSSTDAATSVTEQDLPPPPECAVDTDGAVTEKDGAEDDPGLPPAHGVAPQGKASPYSVIDIAPLPHQQPPSSSPPTEPEPGIPDEPTVPLGYSVPMPSGYAVPSNVPVLTPAYTTPVIIRHLSMDEDVTVVRTCSTAVDIEEFPAIREEDALSRWVSDPANTAWMDNPDEVIYDDVPRENSDSTTDPEEMIYDDVELGEEGGSSSLDNGWSSSEFESYDEHSDGEGQGRNGLPDAFMRGRAPRNKTHLSQDLTRLKEHYEKKMKDLVANTVGTVELQQIRQKQEQKMQKLVKAAKEGTKDGLEKTKAVVKKGRSFIKTKSFCQERKSSCMEEEGDLFIEVDCFNVEPVLGPMPEGLTQQQVVRRYILQSILESEKNYLDALKRILEHYERPLSEMDPRLLSERKLKMTFYRVREILQCHALFQIALASRVAEWDASEMIGDVFVASFSKSMVLDAYSEYVNNFSTAMGVLKKTCASKLPFVEFLKHCQDSSGDRVTLYGLMMKPIQRFPQFILLLQDMLKNTPIGHADRLPLQMALTELETLAEKLNEKKREADQRCEVRHIAKAINERYLNKLLSSDSRYLIRSDDMVETVYNDRGEMIKTKERRIFLLNDVLMCATPNVRGSQDVSGGNGGGGSAGQKLLLKWSVPLSLVDMVEFGSSEEAGEGGHFVAPHSGENVVINARLNKLYVGPGQLYQDLQNLIHDLGLVKQISSMIGSLKGNYQNVNSAVAQDWVSGLQRLILKKEEEIRAADRCRIQLQLPGKHDKSGRPTHFTAVFNTFTPAVKQSWISSLQMAKLALEEDNLQGWFFAEDDGNHMKKRKHPLLLRQMPVVMSKLQEFKVECAVHNPEPLYNTESTADTPALGYGCVWVASCTNQMGQISVVSLQSPTPKVTECFNVESRILCMVHVPPEHTQEADGSEVPENNVTPGRGSDTPTVCLGMEEGSISVYKSSQRSKKIRLQHFFTPDKSTVMSLVYTAQCLYAGLVSGSVAIFSRSPDGSWSSDSPKVVKLGVLPVKSLLAVEGHVWASSGGLVFIINTKTHAIERQLEAHQEEGMVVSHMVVAGVGIWIAFSSRSTLRLFHTETLEHLQDINIATPVHHMLSGQQRVSVSSLLVCHGLLLVGTNLGVTVALSVPRLQGIPKVTGRGMVSFHAHNGPVKFLTMATAICNRPPEDPCSTPTTATTSTTDPSTASEPSDPTLAPTPPPRARDGEWGVWLGESGGCQASLHSSCGSLVPSQSSLEHGTEDGTIYDLLNDPAHSHWGRRAAERVTAGSALAVSGGAGHRRVNRKTKQSRQEEAAATIMVWQIPLLNL